MEQINEWLKQFSTAVLTAFPDRIRFIGIQGSHARNEASPTSDIDVVVIFDQLCGEDLRRYDAVIGELPHRDLICGFLGGEGELRHWDRSELFQFAHDTKAVYGDLNTFLPAYDKADIARAVHAGGCAIYHACVHNQVHEKSLTVLQALYKQAVFVLQAKHTYEHDVYIARKSDLIHELGESDGKILTCGERIKHADASDIQALEYYGDVLMQWASELIRGYDSRVYAGDAASV